MSSETPSIWTTTPQVGQVNEMFKGTMCEVLSIRVTEIRAGSITASMPVNSATVQPFDILHGGASVALAESLASVAAYFCRKDEDATAVGVEINANHLRSVKAPATVIGTARPIHLGRTSQVWGVDIHDDSGKKVCVCRATILCIRR